MGARNMSSTETPPAAQPEFPATPASPNWSQRITKIVGIVLAVVFGLIGVAKIITWNDLPGCDSKRAKDTLSTIFKEKNVKASGYDSIDTVSKKDDEIQCNAKLTLDDKSKISINYKLTKENGEMRLFIVDATPI